MHDMLNTEFFHSLEETINSLSDSDIPAKIFWGELDNSNPLKQGKKLNGILKNSELTVLKGAGHISNADDPETFNRLTVEFLKA